MLILKEARSIPKDPLNSSMYKKNETRFEKHNVYEKTWQKGAENCLGLTPAWND